MRYLFLLFLSFLAVTAYADEGTAPAPLLKDKIGMSLYFQGGYTYNFDRPASGENGLRLFDHKSDKPTLDLIQLVLANSPDKGLGYKLKFSAGETAKFIHSLGLGISAGEDPEHSPYFDVTEAYLTYTTPIGRGLKFQAGKFATMCGAEVIEAIDDINYSRGFLFNYAIPFTHTGLGISYPFTNSVSATGWLLNGWDNFEDVQDARTGGITMALTPIDPVSLTFNALYGPEKASNDDDRFLLDVVGTFKATDKLSFTLNPDYGTEQHAAPSGGEAKWYGAAGYAKYDLTKVLSASIRGEYFKDKDGFRTGTAQEMKEVTFTPEIRTSLGVILRPEYRHDWSDQASFNGKKEQDTLALGVMYRW
jgi:hypothetical protein